ncbi:MAG: NAD(P)/FAD-dependent oxidoreductase [Chthoniobacterales bacterium]
MDSVDVIIIGAGASGLMAASKLYAEGCKVVILEARNRIGGRIFTEHTDGAATPVELGAEFIHGKPKETLTLLKRAGLEMTEGLDSRLLADENGLQPFTYFWDIIEHIHEQIDETRSVPYADFLAKATAAPLWKRMAKSYVEGFNAADAQMISTEAVSAEEKAAAKIEGEKVFRIPAGYDALMKELAGHLPAESIHLKTVVREIHWRRDRVEILADTPDGVQVYSTARIIITVPLGVLLAGRREQGAIHIKPVLPHKNQALRRLKMGHVLKLAIRFEERFWESHGPFGFATTLDADVPVWWTQEPTISNILIGWTGGPLAERLVKLPLAQITNRAVASLAQIFGKSENELSALVTNIYWHNWSEDPFSRGAYSYPGVEGLQAARVLAEPVEDTLFFAGEATDFNGANGTVHGALASGIRVAKEISALLSNSKK